MCDILKVSGLGFEMVNSLEMYVIYCIITLAMIIFRLRLNVAHLSASESMNESALSVYLHKSACSQKNDRGRQHWVTFRKLALRGGQASDTIVYRV
jgi:hypothetical protein